MSKDGCIITAASLLYCMTLCYSKQLHIAVVLPLEHSMVRNQPTSSWERGLEILPGAQIAIEHINQREDILPGHSLELNVINSVNCKNGLNQDLLVNFINFTVYQNVSSTIGLVGSFCSNSDRLLSSLLSASASLRNQPFLSSSASMSVRNKGLRTPPQYYRILQSANIFIDAITVLASDSEWQRIAVVTELRQSYFLSVAEAFYDIATESKSHKIIPFIQLHEGFPLELVFQKLQTYNSKIIVISLSVAHAIDMLCSAKDRGLTWPDYAWIVHSITFTDFSLATEFADLNSCNIQTALEGVILLEHRLNGKTSLPGTTSSLMGYTNEDYFKKYMERLANLSAKVNAPLRPNAYANLLHDSVWALALAFQHGQVNNSILAIVSNISFMGTMGIISFNGSLEITTGVDIFQIKNGSPIHEGFYHPSVKNIDYVGSLLENPRPSVKHTIITDNTSIVYTSVFSLVFLLCVAGVTLTLFFYIYYRNEPEIKATSVTLSLLMFLGCYVILFYMLMAILYTQSLVPSDSQFNICLTLLWSGATGVSLTLILATLLVKTLRVYHIFNHFGKVGKMYSDIALLFYVLLLISPNIIIHTIWSIVDPYSADTIITEYPSYTEVEQRCYSKQILLWFCILYLNIEGLAVILIIVAVKTRKIHRENFKDTKKVNAFIFILLIVIYVISAQWIIFRSIGVKKGYASIPLHIGHVIIVVSCQGLLFIPKILPPLQRNFFNKS